MSLRSIWWTGLMLLAGCGSGGGSTPSAPPPVVVTPPLVVAIKPTPVTSVDAIAQAEKRGMYVTLDLHGAVGSQGWEQHSGCAGKNLYWSTPEFQQRTVWLWQQVAARYKDRVGVAGYSVLNEPWGTDAANLAAVVKTLYTAIRAVDPNHVVILPGHNSGISAYGKPSEQGMSNVAFEMHFYPGLFGWSQIGLPVHKDWLTCAGGSSGSNSSGVCEWDRRLRNLDSAFFIGEMQPWTGQGLDLVGQITRATFDTYAKYGWASTAWSWKVVSNSGGQGSGTWGMVTNAAGASVAKTDFTAASLSDIDPFQVLRQPAVRSASAVAGLDDQQHRTTALPLKL
ncbi:glycoside hydrolase family 5 protein [Duganella sp. BuS-21]|uniref:glycoside hydrolase family 5 protein n=1 Tax=Duganella sp. BuS-21 TaxID=2943848 RepID=UPI0035A6D2FB